MRSHGQRCGCHRRSPMPRGHFSSLPSVRPEPVLLEPTPAKPVRRGNQTFVDRRPIPRRRGVLRTCTNAQAGPVQVFWLPRHGPSSPSPRLDLPLTKRLFKEQLSGAELGGKSGSAVKRMNSNDSVTAAGPRWICTTLPLAGRGKTSALGAEMNRDFLNLIPVSIPSVALRAVLLRADPAQAPMR